MSGPAWGPDSKYTVSVDFDGVLHSYRSKWVAPEVIPDAPVNGAIDWLHEISEQFEVVIHTTRAATQAGIDAVRAWLLAHEFDARGVLITDRKVPALIYVDDRGYRFDGKNWPTPNMILNELYPWNRQPFVR